MTSKNGHANGNGLSAPVKAISSFINDFNTQIPRISEDNGVIQSLLNSLLSGGIVDDRELLLEHVIQWAASYPAGSPTAGLLSNAMTANLWDNLKHPPLSYMGDKWRYRMADGSHNNILYPDLGKAGSYYARSVVPQHSPPAALPDAGDVFDALFARKGLAKEHPAKFSSIAISLATIIIHDVFRTDDQDSNKVKSSSYLDLGPLYGHDQEMQYTVRTGRDGKLKPDTFAEPRILGQPPGVGALLISFGRFHNYVVEQLAEINEGGRFDKPTDLSRAKGMSEDAVFDKRDNDLFQTGRLITCGLYINIVLHDYVRVILNLNRSDTTWTLDPRVDNYDPFDKDGTPKGIGNQVSMEFNLIYRWHATISNKNEAWCEDFFRSILDGKDPAKVTEAEVIAAIKKWGHTIDHEHPENWTFGGLKRNDQGGFNDADLVAIVASTTEDVAGAFGARNVPVALRAIDIMGINQGRAWGTASLNEVRKFFALTPHASFKDMNPDPEVAAALEALYGHIDNVELYPGLVSEYTKPPIVPGSGLCAGPTLVKAILSDAIALVRGDRYYTIDSSPANLTSWGFNEIASDTEVGFGTTIHHLFMRAYPKWFKGNSVYALFPLTIPSENRVILKAKGVEAEYDYDPPRFQPDPTPVLTWKGVTAVLNDQETFKVPWGPHVFELTHHDWMLSGDKPWNAKQKDVCMHALYDPPKGLEQIKAFYEKVTTGLIESESTKLSDHYQIDAVRDVGNTSHAIVAAHIFRIPLEEQGGTLTPTDLYDAMAAVFRYTFLNVDPDKTLSVQAAAKKATKTLLAPVSASCTEVQNNNLSFLESMFHKKDNGDVALPAYGTALIQRLFDAGMSLDEVIWCILPTSGAAAPLQSMAFANLLDFYLPQGKGGAYWPEIRKVAMSDSAEDFEKLRKYALEALRLSPPLPGALRIVDSNSASIQDGEKTLNPPAGSAVSPSYSAAGMDPSVFPDPEQVKLDRSDDLYVHHGWGGHACLGRKIVVISMAVQLKAFARLKNLRRVPGPAGQLKSKVMNGFTVYMNEDWSDWTPFPKSWKLYHDA